MENAVAADNQAVVNRRTLPSFPLAFVIAPPAGSMVAGILATILAAPWRFGLGPWRYQLGVEPLSNRVSGIVGIGLLAALGAFVIASLYTIVFGGMAVVRHAKTGKTSSLPSLLIRGLVAGVLPFASFPVLLGVPSEFTGYDGMGAGWAVAFFLSIAAAASLTTSWVFWRLGFKGRNSRGPS